MVSGDHSNPVRPKSLSPAAEARTPCLPVERAPNIAILAIVFAFFVLGLLVIGDPGRRVFDEGWYVPAAWKMVDLGVIQNREHPMLGKEVIALFIKLFGTTWVAVRLGPLLMAALGLLGFMRAHFALTRCARSTIYFGLLVAGNCLYFTTARTALLDPIMLGFAGLGLALMIEALRGTRFRLAKMAGAGLLMGCAMATKWSVAPLYAVMGLAILFVFRRTPAAAFLYAAVFGISSVIVYLLTFMPLTVDPKYPVPITDWFALHRSMVWYLGNLFATHPYSSPWWIWPLGGGTMWFYDGLPTGGDRIIVLAQNFLAVPITLPAIVVGAAALVRSKSWSLGLPAIVFATAAVFWMASGKPVLFLFHYNLSSIMGLSVAAQLLTWRWYGLWKRASQAYLVSYGLVFAALFPAISGLPWKNALSIYSQLPGWRHKEGAENRKYFIENLVETNAMSRLCMRYPGRYRCDLVVPSTKTVPEDEIDGESFRRYDASDR